MDKAAKCSVTRSWGTPDPRDANAYPKADTPMPTFAWQFLRRRDDYRKRWTQLQRDGGRGCLNPEVNEHRADRCPGDGTHRWQSANEALHDEFRVNSSPMNNGLLDPHLDAPPLFDGAGFVIEILMQADLVKLPKVLIQFDLTLPHEPQLEAARRLLLHTAKIKNFPARPTLKPRKSLLPTFLRLLDFHEEGASEEEIGRTLYPNLSGEQLHDTIRKHFESALKYQDNYLQLALHS